MTPSFFTLFKRGKYYHSKPSADLEEQQREHEEQERFAVAAVGFCLKHDETFRKGFFQKICRRNGHPDLAADFRIEVEPVHWADLRITNANCVYVLEFKILAKIEPKQNPKNSAFKEPSGYGYAMHQNKICSY